MLSLAIKVFLQCFFNAMHNTVNPYPHEPSFLYFFQNASVFSFSISDDRTQDHNFRTGRQAGNLRRYLARALAFNHLFALGAMRNAYAGKQQTEIIIYLRNGSYCGPGIMRTFSLVNGNGRRNTLNAVYVWLVHNPQELASVCR